MTPRLRVPGTGPSGFSEDDGHLGQTFLPQM